MSATVSSLRVGVVRVHSVQQMAQKLRSSSLIGTRRKRVPRKRRFSVSLRHGESDIQAVHSATHVGTLRAVLAYVLSFGSDLGSFCHSDYPRRPNWDGLGNRHSQASEEGVDVQRSVNESGDNDGILQDVEGRTEGRALEAVGTNGVSMNKVETRWVQGTEARQTAGRNA